MSYNKRKFKHHNHEVGDSVRIRDRGENGKHLRYGGMTGTVMDIERVSPDSGMLYAFPQAKLKMANTNRIVYEPLINLVPL